MVFLGGVLLFILGSNLGGVGPARGLLGGGRRGGVRNAPGAARSLGPSYFFIPLVLGPVNSLVWWVISGKYPWGT